MKRRNKCKVRECDEGGFALLGVHLNSPYPYLPAFADPEPRIRMLGLTVLRGPTITLLSPVDGLEEISNPFIGEE